MGDAAPLNGYQPEFPQLTPFWNPRKPFGRKAASPKGPHAGRGRGGPAAPPGPGAWPTGAAPGQYGLPACALTYAGTADTWTVFSALTRDVLGDAMVGEIMGHPDDGSAILPLRSGMVVVMSINAPMPLPDPPDGLAQRAIWDGWRGDAARWRRHAIVGASGAPASLDAARDAAEGVLKVASILASTTEARGINWMGNTLFHQPGDFVTHCQAHAVPPQVVVHPQFYGTAGPEGRLGGRFGLGAVTKGLRLFGLPELDYLPGGDPGAVCNRLFNLAGCLLGGAVLRDGDTVGITGGLRGRIGHVLDPAGDLTLTVTEQDTGGR